MILINFHYTLLFNVLSEDAEKPELLYIAGVYVKWYSCSGKQTAVSYKPKHTHTI